MTVEPFRISGYPISNEILSRIVWFVDQPAKLSTVCTTFYDFVNDTRSINREMGPILKETYHFNKSHFEFLSTFKGPQGRIGHILYKIQTILAKLGFTEPLTDSETKMISTIKANDIPNRLMPACLRSLPGLYAKTTIAFLKIALEEAIIADDLFRVYLILPCIAKTIPEYTIDTLIDLATKNCTSTDIIRELITCTNIAKANITPAIYFSARIGDVDFLNSLIESDVLRKKLNLSTMLDAASTYGHLKIVQRVIEQVLMIDITDSELINAMNNAILSHSFGVFEFLFGRLQEKNWVTALAEALEKAAHCGNLRVFNWVLPHQKAKEIPSKHLNNALHNAAMGVKFDRIPPVVHSHFEIVKALLDKPETRGLDEALAIALICQQFKSAKLIIDDARLGERPDERSDLPLALKNAIIVGALDIANTLFRDPRIEDLLPGLEGAVGTGNATFITAILKDPRAQTIDPTAIVKDTAKNGEIGLLQTILMHPCSANISQPNLSALLKELILAGAMEMATTLLNDPQMPYIENLSSALEAAVIIGNLQLMDTILADPRAGAIDPTDAVVVAINKHDPAILRKFLSHPCLDMLTEGDPNSLLIAAMFFSLE